LVECSIDGIELILILKKKFGRLEFFKIFVFDGFEFFIEQSFGGNLKKKKFLSQRLLNFKRNSKFSIEEFFSSRIFLKEIMK